MTVNLSIGDKTFYSLDRGIFAISNLNLDKNSINKTENLNSDNSSQTNTDSNSSNSNNSNSNFDFIKNTDTFELSNQADNQSQSDNYADQIRNKLQNRNLKDNSNINSQNKNQKNIQKNTQNNSQNNISKDSSDKGSSNTGIKILSPNEQKLVDELKSIDANVRTHENAHQMAGGSLVRGKSFSYTTGPDGKQYAIGGEVKIDMSASPDDPNATINKMEQVKRAALAPADPSPQDRSVASAAETEENQAREELRTKSNETILNKSPLKNIIQKIASASSPSNISI